MYHLMIDPRDLSLFSMVRVKDDETIWEAIGILDTGIWLIHPAKQSLSGVRPDDCEGILLDGELLGRLGFELIVSTERRSIYLLRSPLSFNIHRVHKSMEADKQDYWFGPYGAGPFRYLHELQLIYRWLTGQHLNTNKLL